MTADLLEKITQGRPVLCVVGQGYVGLSIAAAAAAAGLPTFGLDNDVARIAQLSQGHNVVPGVSEEVFESAHESDLYLPTTDAGHVSAADVVLICVPTPVKKHRPDLSHIETAAHTVAARLTRGTLVVLESTTYPGTTEQVVVPILESGGLRSGKDFLVAYSPERIDPGNTKFGLRNTPRVVGGMTSEATEAAAAFYRLLVDDVMSVSSCRAAEMAKLLENTFRMVNIALVNELATLSKEQGIDVWEVIDAAATKPFGFMPFYPGPGVGGHCIPLDPTYLAWQSRRDTGRAFRLVETAQEINAAMPSYVTRRVVEALYDRGTSVRGARVLALGVTYKPDVGDLRESAAVEILARLRREGAVVEFHDPFIAQIRGEGVDLDRSKLTEELVRSADAVLLLTPHSSYDLAAIMTQAQLVFDARNAIGLPRPDSVVSL